MSIFDTLLTTIAPYDCLVCGEEDRLLCNDCTPLLGSPVPSRCFHCLTETDNWSICSTCQKTVPLDHVWVRFAYAKYVKALVHEFKFNGKRAAAKEIARCMYADLPKGAVLCEVPTATKRVRERGYDHAKLLAKALSRTLDLPHASLLARATQVRQLGARRSERHKNIQGAFRVTKDVRGLHVILVDDVVTTGATLAEATVTLIAAGAAKVDAVVFAQTPSPALHSSHKSVNMVE